MKKRFDIKIMGQEFAVLSDKGDEHVESVVQYVNDKAHEIRSASKNVTTLSMAILVALDIADELFSLKEEKKIFYNLLETKTEKLISYIEDNGQ